MSSVHLRHMHTITSEMCHSNTLFILRQISQWRTGVMFLNACTWTEKLTFWPLYQNTFIRRLKQFSGNNWRRTWSHFKGQRWSASRGFVSIIHHTIRSTSCDNVKELMTLHKLQWFCIVANNSIQMFWLPPGLLLANLTKISRIWQFVYVRERLKLPDALNQSIKKFYSTVVSNGKMWG